MRVANNPGARLGEQMEAALYLNHPYGRPVIGWRQEIEKLDREDALAFYRRFYTPNNAILVVAGDVTADEVKTLAEETYGKVAARRRDRPAHAPAGAGAGGRAHRDARRPARHPAEHAALLSRAVRARPRKPGESEALDVLAHILGRGSNSRLYRALVVDKGIAVNAGAGYSTAPRSTTTRFGVYGTPKPGVTLAAARGGDRRRPRRGHRQGVTAEELERAKNRLIADAVYAQDNQAHAGALVWRGADHRRDRRAGADLARPHPRGHRRCRCATPRASWLDKRRSVTGYLVKDTASPRRNAREHAPSRHCRAPRGLLAARSPALCSRSRRAAAHATKIERVVSPGGIEAWLVRDADGAADRARLRLPRRRRPGSGRTSPASPTWRSSLLDEGAGDLDAKAFHERLERKAIELSFQRRPRLRPRLAAHAQGEPRRGLRLSAARAHRAALRRRRGRAHPRADHVAAAARRPRTRTTSRAATGGQTAFPGPSLWAAGQRHARIGAAHHRRRPARPMRSACSRATTSRSRVVGDIDADDRRPARRPHVRLAAGQGRARAGRADVAPQGLGRRIVVDLDVPQSVVTFGGAGIAAQRSRFHGRLHRQPHPRRRLVLLAALPRGAREARPRLRRLRQPGLAQSRRACCSAAPRRAPTRTGETHRRDRARNPAGWPRKGRPRRSSARPRPTSRAPSRSASTPRPRSPPSSCRCSSTISASTISSAAPA